MGDTDRHVGLPSDAIVTPETFAPDPVAPEADAPEPEPVAPGSFAQRVVRVLGRTRPGDVVTYGELAAEAAAPGAARAVGRVLRDHGADLSWWRVVTTTGRLVPGLEDRQASLLAAEGVTCAQGRVVRSPPVPRA